MSKTRLIAALAIGTFGPPLTVLQAIETSNLTNAPYWLNVATVTVSAFASSGLTILTVLSDVFSLPRRGSNERS